MASRPPITAKLVIIEGKDKGKIINLSHGSTIIGRTKGDIIVQDSRVSRSHVSIYFDETTDRLTFKDLKSLNGTQVNGATQEKGTLNDGDKLQIGNTLFDCQMDQASKSTSKKITEDSQVESSLRELSESSINVSGSDSISIAKRREPDASEMIPLDKPLHLDHEHRKEPKKMEASADDDHPPESLMSKLKSSYQRLPPTVRGAGLLGIILYAALTYNGSNSDKEASTGGQSKELASIKSLGDQGKTQEALDKALELAQREPKNPQAQLLLGNIYSTQNKLEAAIAAYQKAKELKPTPSLVHIQLIRLYLRVGLLREAEEEMTQLDRAIKEDPHNKDLFLEAAKLFVEFRELKQPPEKLYILAKALQTEIAPTSSVGYKLEAQVLLQQQKMDEALLSLEKALSLDPQDEWLLESIAFAKVFLKDFPGAIAAAESWAKIHPQSPKPLLIFGYLKSSEKKYDEAMPVVERLITMAESKPNDPLIPEAYFLKGQVLFGLNKLKDAEAAFAHSCKLGYKQSCQFLETPQTEKK